MTKTTTNQVMRTPLCRCWSSTRRYLPDTATPRSYLAYDTCLGGGSRDSCDLNALGFMAGVFSMAGGAGIAELPAIASTFFTAYGLWFSGLSYA